MFLKSKVFMSSIATDIDIRYCANCYSSSIPNATIKCITAFICSSGIITFLAENNLSD